MGVDAMNPYRASASIRWYHTIKFYNFWRPAYREQAKTFTQMVWKATTEVGFGYALGTFTEDHVTYTSITVVARYSPAGNKGDFKENVIR